jgi:CRP/FNR family transcriptional regulator
MWNQLLQGGGDQAHVVAGEFVYRAGEKPAIALVLTGVVRLFIRTAAGRQVTARYARPGDLIGLGAVLAGSRVWNAEAIGDATLMMMTVEHLHRAAIADPELPWKLAAYIAASASEAVSTLANTDSEPMAVRVALHLRELAQRTPEGRAVAHISHQGLADAVGTAREVVTRELRGLRAAGVIESGRTRIAIVDETRLASIAAGSSTRD